MPRSSRSSSHIIAMGGGGFSMEPDNPALDRYVLGVARRQHPRVCFVATASGDADGYIERFYQAFESHDCEVGHLALFGREVADLRTFVLSQDVVYVGGGSTANLLAVWRVHGLDAILREAWARGVVLAGVSAGALCWFECGVTDSFGPELAALRDGLGILPGSHCPHYDGESRRRPTYHHCILAGLPDGIAADDGVGLHFIGTALHRVVSSREAAAAYLVKRVGDSVTEQRLEAALLG